MRRLAIVGVSNLLSDVLDCALAIGCTDFVVVTNVPEVVRPRTRPFRDRLAELPQGASAQVVPLESFAPRAEDACFIGTTAAGRHRLVEQLRERFRIPLAGLVHPSAYVSPLALMAEGVFVGARSVIGPAAVLHQGAFINRGASVGHDTLVGPYARIQPGANVGGHVRIGAFATVGIGASVIEETEIGDAAIVAGGAVVTGDVPAGQLVAGVPAVARKAVDEAAELPTWDELAPRLSAPVRWRLAETGPSPRSVRGV